MLSQKIGGSFRKSLISNLNNTSSDSGEEHLFSPNKSLGAGMKIKINKSESIDYDEHDGSATRRKKFLKKKLSSFEVPKKEVEALHLKSSAF
jgi:hypothetical protein